MHVSNTVMSTVAVMCSVCSYRMVSKLYDEDSV